MKKIRIPLLFSIILFLAYNCKKDDMTPESIDTDATTLKSTDSEPVDRMVLGERLENPYSVDNMQIAYTNLLNSSSTVLPPSSGIEIDANYLYVRFLPKDPAELDMLRSYASFASLELFDYPLDYEILAEGSYYHDPEIPEDRPTWLYTTVPVGFQFPNIKYEIIEECFIPDDEDNSELYELYGLIEDEAFRITGNLDEESGLKSANEALAKASKPKGTIRVWNTIAGLEGVMGVKVRVHNIVKWDADYTDASGNYQMGKKFRTNVHYAVIFENSRGFKTWGNWAFLAPANYNMGWHSNSGYSRDIWQSSDAWKWATVNNAVYKYIDYCDVFSISTPPSNLRVWVFEKGNGTVTGSAAMLKRTWGLYGFNTTSKLNTFFNWMLGINISTTILGNLVRFVAPDITISVNSGSAVTDDVHNVTFHECAHASHWTKVGSSYWVKYINYIITYGAYGNGTGENAGYCGVGEMWGNYIGALYEREEFITYWPYNSTPFGNDWRWFDEQEEWFNPGFLKHVDNITDISTSEIFSCMTSSTNTILKMVSQLKTKTENDEQVDNAYNRTEYNDWP